MYPISHDNVTSSLNLCSCFEGLTLTPTINVLQSEAEMQITHFITFKSLEEVF